MLLFKLIIKNAFRSKLRTILTILGLVIAVVAFGFLRTVVEAWYSGVEASSASRLITRNAISLVFRLPISYKEKIKQIEGVQIVSYGNWFGGVYIDPKNFFANFAVEPKSYLDLYPEYIVSEEEKIAFFRDKRGAIAGKKLIDKFGWKIGDTITLKGTIYPGEWEFVLKGIYKGRDRNIDESQFFFHWDYLNEGLKKKAPAFADQTGFYIVGVTDPRLAAIVSERIDGTFKNSLAETVTETEKAFQLSFIYMTEAILIVIQAVSLIVIIIILAVVANTMAMSVRERLAEFAVLKTIGFGKWNIILLIFGESILITTIGCFFGIILTFPAAKAFADEMSNYFPIFNVTRETICLDIAVSFLIGILAAIIPTLRAINVNIAESLTRIR
ncbi:MAG: FtsX-like permease family protein [Thermodesulfovibrionales bacterium]|nr:FtsX-like permease family protein [Thermodesulfovibrionales bacterium]